MLKQYRSKKTESEPFEYYMDDEIRAKNEQEKGFTVECREMNPFKNTQFRPLDLEIGHIRSRHLIGTGAHSYDEFLSLVKLQEKGLNYKQISDKTGMNYQTVILILSGNSPIYRNYRKKYMNSGIDEEETWKEACST